MKFGPFGVLIMMALAIAVVAIIFVMIPTLGDAMEKGSVPLSPHNGSGGVAGNNSFNKSLNSGIIRGGDFWATYSVYIGILTVMIVVAIALGYLMGIGGGRRG